MTAIKKTLFQLYEHTEVESFIEEMQQVHEATINIPAILSQQI